MPFSTGCHVFPIETDSFILLMTQVDPRYFPMLASWRRQYTMEGILVELKKEMASPANRKLQQPPEGSTY